MAAKSFFDEVIKEGAAHQDGASAGAQSFFDGKAAPVKPPDKDAPPDNIKSFFDGTPRPSSFLGGDV